MPRQARKKSSTGIYHVMLRGINRQDIFEDAEDYWKFIQAISTLPDRLEDGYVWPASQPGTGSLGANQGACPHQQHTTCAHIYAYCLMPNHAHILLMEKQWTVSQCVKLIADIYVRYYNKKYGRTGHLFQDRFKSEPCNSMEYFVTLLRYIHQNPVKAGLSPDPRSYHYSSWGNDYYMLGSIQCCHTQTVLHRITFSELEALVNEPLPAAAACLDIDDRRIVSDAEVRKLIIKKRHLHTISDFLLLTMEKRKETIREVMLELGCKPFQITRVSGMNYETVRKIAKNL